MDEQVTPGDLSAPAIPTAPEPSPISDRKLAANRANAQRSTGPRTARGKARSAMNAVKHGVLAKRRAPARPGVLSQGLVIPKLEGHRASVQFRALMSALVADRQPIGALEMLMVQEIGVCTWRLRRLLKYENRVAFENSLLWSEPPSIWDELREKAVGAKQVEYEDEGERILAETGLNGLSMPDSEEVVMISRYENGLMRHLFRAIDQLDRMQRQRRAIAPEREEKTPIGRLAFPGMQRQRRAEASEPGTEKATETNPSNDIREHSQGE